MVSHFVVKQFRSVFSVSELSELKSHSGKCSKHMVNRSVS